MIRAPFNFVPLSEKVFFPDWAGEISQDIPFEDGVSGTIDLTITAETPIFIRNGHAKDTDKDSEEYKSFSHVTGPDGKPIYFIPATTIKGEVRTLLEIMSYSKMTVDKRAMFARRDLNNSQLYPLIKKQEEIRCGWMKRNDDFSGYTVTSCGRPMRIMQMKIDEYLESIRRGSHVLENAFCKEKNRRPLPDGKRSATYKYVLLRDVKLDNLTFREKGRRRDKTKNLVYDPRGNVKGTIVLTGQPGYWKKNYGKKENRGKCYEFVFPSRTEGSYEVTNEMFAHYAFIYEKSDDWKRIKSLLVSDKGAPVFFRVSGNEILDFGMAYLYKMPYEKSVEESMPQNHRESKADLAQCIFGYTDAEGIKDCNGDATSLKGRVQFGNAFAEPKNVKLLGEKALPLQSPKASYLPLYVDQKNDTGQLQEKCDQKGKKYYEYKTYDDGHPSGWKAYYRRTATWGRQAPVNANQEDTQNTHFKPLDKGCVFKGVVSFHNLRPVELGALLCAINFAKFPNCHHLLGLAKPYGYGCCKYAAKLTLTTPGQGEAYFMEQFKEMMSRELKGDWLHQKEIESLFAIALCYNLPQDEYGYMHMDTKRENNEYIIAQSKGECLCPINSIPTFAEGYKKQLKEYDRTIEENNRLIEEEKRNLKEQQRLAELEAEKQRWATRIEEAKASDRPLPALSSLQTEIGDEARKAGVDERRKTMLDDMSKMCDDAINAIITESNSQSSEPTTLQALLTEGSSYGQWEGKIKKWLKDHSPLNEEEQDYAFDKLCEAYRKTSSSKKDQKKWELDGENHRKCRKLTGEDLANEWFKKLHE